MSYEVRQCQEIEVSYTNSITTHSNNGKASRDEVGCYATSNITQGQLLLKCKPTVKILNYEQLPLRCYHCWQLKQLKRCSACKIARYCSSYCQKEDWREHKHICSILHNLLSKATLTSTPNTWKTIMLCIHLLLKLSLDSSLSVPIFNLIHHTSNEEQTMNSNFGDQSTTRDDNSNLVSSTSGSSYLEDEIRFQKSMAEYIFLLISPLPIFSSLMTSLSLQKIFELIQKLRCNVFNVNDDELVIYAAALYLPASSFNHSCAPNAVVTFIGSEIQVRAVQTIPSQHEITISYVDRLLPRIQRHADLRSSFHFNCRCTFCSSPSFEKYENEIERYRCNRCDCSFIISHHDHKEIMCRELQQPSLPCDHSFSSLQPLLSPNLNIPFDRLFSNYVHLLSYNPVEGNGVVIQYYGLIIAEYISQAMYDEAEKFCQLKVNSILHRYDNGDDNDQQKNIIWPSIGIDYYMLAKLQNVRGNVKDSAINLQMAERIIRICYGDEHPLYHNLLQFKLNLIGITL